MNVWGQFHLKNPLDEEGIWTCELFIDIPLWDQRYHHPLSVVKVMKQLFFPMLMPFLNHDITSDLSRTESSCVAKIKSGKVFFSSELPTSNTSSSA
jgi:hypothetical protein